MGLFMLGDTGWEFDRLPPGQHPSRLQSLLTWAVRLKVADMATAAGVHSEPRMVQINVHASSNMPGGVLGDGHSLAARFTSSSYA